MPSEPITSTGQRKVYSRKWRMLFILIVLLFIGGVASAVFLPKYLANKESAETQKKANTASDNAAEQSRQQTLNATAGPNASAEQQYVLLMAKVNTEAVVGNWSGVENYAQQALALEGHASDPSALAQLATAQKNLGKKSEYKQTLQKIKSYLDGAGLTDSDYYRNITEELSK